MFLAYSFNDNNFSRIPFFICLASGGVPHTWWPDVGPHIIEVPPTSVYIRTDKIDTRKLTCKAVGKYPVKYQWIKHSQVCYPSELKEFL